MVKSVSSGEKLVWLKTMEIKSEAHVEVRKTGRKKTQ